MAPGKGRDELVHGLVRTGELLVKGGGEVEVDAYYAPGYKFHGPGGGGWDYEGLMTYLRALRAAFDDLSIERGLVVVEGRYVACQTAIRGTFVRDFTHSPVGNLPPNGKRVTFELMNIFRYDEADRLAEEWVQTDNRFVLRQLESDSSL